MLGAQILLAVLLALWLHFFGGIWWTVIAGVYAAIAALFLIGPAYRKWKRRG